MTTWMTSDNHFFHKNVIRYSSRPFKNVDEMNEGMIARWNARVKPGERVICHGDFSFGSPLKTSLIMQRLNGELELLIGNHDEDSALKSPALELWKSVRHYLEFEHKDERTAKTWRFVCFHFPIERNSHHWAARQTLHTTGHRHMPSLMEDQSLMRFDVGVDANNWAPISLEEIIDAATASTWKPPKRDHHGVNQ